MRRVKIQIAIVVTAALVSMASNWIRVLGLIVIGDRSSMEAEILRDHGTYGWLIFVLGLVPTFLIAHRLQKRDLPALSPSEILEKEGTSGRRPTDESTSPGAEDPPRSSTGSPPWRRVLAPSGAALIGPMLFMVVGAIPRGGVIDLRPEDLGLEHPAEFLESDGTTPRGWTPAYAGIDERRAWTAAARGTPVRLERFLYVDQGPGEELIQDGNRIAPDSALVAERSFSTDSQGGRIVREALIRTNGAPILVWYWYRVAGIERARLSRQSSLRPSPSSAAILRRSWWL